MHTVLKRRIPRALFVVMVAAVLFIGMAVYLATRVKNKISPVPVPEVSQEHKGQISPGGPPTSRSEQLAENPLQYMTDFMPRHMDYPESAPAYDAVRVVKSFPVIAGCIKTEKFCKCVSQQGTDVQVTPDRCLAILANKVFDPYRESPRAPEVVASLADVGQLQAQHPTIAAALPSLAPAR